MNRRTTALPALLTFLLLAGASAPTSAKVFHSREGAFKLAFPRADKVERKHVFLTAAQRKQIQQTCRCRYEAKLLTVYVGKRGGATLGYAYIETHRVRTLSETFMVVLDLKGAVSGVHILAFHEPPEYMPRSGWLAQFRGRTGRGGKAIAGLAGATMSAHAIMKGVARILATHRAVGLGAPARATAAR